MSGIQDVTGQRRWGIIGDGQLARMLAMSCYPLGIRPVILTGDSSSPAGQVTPLIVRGHMDQRDDLHGLLSQVDGAIIESEFVDCDALEATGLSNKVVPSLSVIRTLQNKWEQKKLLISLSIPTSDLHSAPDLNAQTDWVHQLTQKGTKPIVLKFATFGYDGKGVLVLKGQGEQDLEAAEDFLHLARKRKITIYAEDFVPFSKELAMIAVRKQDGDFKIWPLVISEQKNGICDRVMGPATSLGIPQKIEDQAKSICQNIAAHLGLVGVFAVEFFLTNTDELLVNEIAPRVHNSGHFSQNAGGTSQFENHWRAVLDLPLGTTETVPFFAMQNILGLSDLLSKDCAIAPEPSELTFVNWYGKRGFSPGRKLGHFNATCHNLDQKGDALSALQSAYGRWQLDQKKNFPNSISVKGPIL